MRNNIWVLVAIIVLSIMPAGVQAQSDEGLVAEWHFDEGAGSVLKDSSGNGNDGVIYGATWVEGKYGNALNFNGINNYALTSNLARHFSEDSVTIEVWFNANGPGIIVAELGQGTINSGWHDSQIEILNTGEVKVRVWKLAPVSLGTVNFNEWHHAVLRYNKAASNLDGLLDGVEASTDIIGDRSSPWEYEYGLFYAFGPTDVTNLGSGRYFNGELDEVRIYNRALSAEDIKEHFEQGATALALTKTASPQSIKQGQSTTITLTVKNTGSTEINDIEIADTIPKDITFIDGETSKTYASLSPKDSRQFQYVLQFDEAGTFNLAPATASYADDEGNYKTVKSKIASVEVIPSLVSNSAQKSSAKSDVNAQTASVNLHGEKTDVVLGEDVLLKLSAVNIIGNPTMHVQVIIIPPSGWSVTSSEFAKSGAGQYTTTYELESGGGKDIEVRIVPNQIGDDFQVEGRIIYYFGDDVSTREDHTLSLPIKVRAESDDGQKPSTDSEESKTPGFGVLVAVIGLLITAHLIKIK